MRRLLVRVVPVAALAGALVLGAVVPAGADSDEKVSAFATFMTGATEIPGPGDPDGFGVFVAASKGNVLCYLVTARRIEPAAAAHIHAGPAGVAGPIVVGLIAPTGGFARDCITAVPDDQNSTATLTVSELAAIKANPSDFYVNVHNAPFPAGAIRGNLRG